MKTLAIDTDAMGLPDMFGLAEKDTHRLVFAMAPLVEAWTKGKMLAGALIADVANLATTEEERAFLLMMLAQEMLILMTKMVGERDKKRMVIPIAMGQA